MGTKCIIKSCFSLCFFLTLVGCATIDAQLLPFREARYYPKASPDASIVITLQSNKENTDFYIDDKWIVKGKIVKVLINDRPHIIKSNRKDTWQRKITFNLHITLVLHLGSII